MAQCLCPNYLEVYLSYGAKHFKIPGVNAIGFQ